MDRWIGCLDVWMDGWMDGHKDECKDYAITQNTVLFICFTYSSQKRTSSFLLVWVFVWLFSSTWYPFLPNSLPVQISPMTQGSVEGSSLTFLSTPIQSDLPLPWAPSHHSIDVYWTRYLLATVLGLKNTTALILHLFFSSTDVCRLTLQRIPNTLLWISNSAESKLHYLPVVLVTGLDSGGWVAILALWPLLTWASQETPVSYLETHPVSKDPTFG